MSSGISLGNQGGSAVAKDSQELFKSQGAKQASSVIGSIDGDKAGIVKVKSVNGGDGVILDGGDVEFSQTFGRKKTTHLAENMQTFGIETQENGITTSKRRPPSLKSVLPRS